MNVAPTAGIDGEPSRVAAGLLSTILPSGSTATIGIADAVSEILAEPAASDINLQTHYYYYM